MQMDAIRPLEIPPPSQCAIIGVWWCWRLTVIDGSYKHIKESNRGQTTRGDSPAGDGMLPASHYKVLAYCEILRKASNLDELFGITLVTETGRGMVCQEPV
jgi:hypothetical protein